MERKLLLSAYLLASAAEHNRSLNRRKDPGHIRWRGAGLFTAHQHGSCMLA